MRFQQSNISAISNCIANQGIQLVVRVEAVGSRVASSVHALIYGVSHLINEMRHSMWHRPFTTWTTTGRTSAMVGCFVVAKRRQRQLVLNTRCRTLA